MVCAEACIPIPESNKVPVISMPKKAAAILPFLFLLTTLRFFFCPIFLVLLKINSNFLTLLSFLCLICNLYSLKTGWYKKDTLCENHRKIPFISNSYLLVLQRKCL